MSAERIATLEARVAALEATIASLRAVFTGVSTDVASDSDLDSARGDEKIRMNPRDWKGESHKGRTMSRSVPDFLDLYAETMDFFASKNLDATKAGYDRRSASRARGWAKRMRGGWVAPPPPPEPESPFNPNGAAPPSDGFGSGGGFGSDTSFDYGANTGAGGEDEIPFIHNATLFGRRDRP